MEIKITKDNFEQEVLKSDIPVIVDFWATWCGPCKMLAPTIEEIAREQEGKIKVGKINIDEEIELAQKYRIAAIPTVVCFRDGEAVSQIRGYVPKEDIENLWK